jgi:uncharacterized protein YyaL (SSP411 family)
VVGPADDPATAGLHHTALLGTAPGAVVAVGPSDGGDGAPLLAGRTLVGGRPAAYVCRGFVCDAPVTDVGALAERLGTVAGGSGQPG